MTHFAPKIAHTVSSHACSVPVCIAGQSCGMRKGKGERVTENVAPCTKDIYLDTTPWILNLTNLWVIVQLVVLVLIGTFYSKLVPYLHGLYKRVA